MSRMERQNTETVWNTICSRLKVELGDAHFNSWLLPLVPQQDASGHVSLFAPTSFIKDWIEKNYADRIRALWQEEDQAFVSLSFGVRARMRQASSAAPRSAASSLNEASSEAPKIPASRPPLKNDRLVGSSSWVESAQKEAAVDLSTPLRADYTFDSFVVGQPNSLAHAIAERVAESDTVFYNPLFFYGGTGLGKTHLMQAIAHRIREKNPTRRVAYMSAEKFMYRFVHALKNNDAVSFKEQLRSIDVLMIDDLQFICGKKKTLEEFFHTFNALVDQGKQVVLSANKAPTELEGLDESLRSRLAGGFSADIQPTTYELRLGIVKTKAALMGANVPLKVQEFLAHKVSTNARDLEGALKRVVAHAQLIGAAITLDQAQEVLKDILSSLQKRLTIDDIQRRVAEHYDIRLLDMASSRRARAVARPRQVAMYLAKQLTERSLPEIGRKFGGRDHTTVMYAVKKIDELCQADPAFGEEVSLLRRLLEA